MFSSLTGYKHCTISNVKGTYDASTCAEVPKAGTSIIMIKIVHHKFIIICMMWKSHMKTINYLVIYADQRFTLHDSDVDSHSDDSCITVAIWRRSECESRYNYNWPKCGICRIKVGSASEFESGPWLTEAEIKFFATHPCNWFGQCRDWLAFGCTAELEIFYADLTPLSKFMEIFCLTWEFKKIYQFQVFQVWLQFPYCIILLLAVFFIS